MTPEKLNQMANTAGNQVHEALRETLRYDLDSHIYPKEQDHSHLGLRRLQLHGLISQSERRLLEKLVHVASLVHEPGLGELECVGCIGVVNDICGTLLQEHVSPTTKAIASIVSYWTCEGCPADRNSEDILDSQIISKAIETEYLRSLLEAAIAGASAATSAGSSCAIEGALREATLALRSYYEYETREVRRDVIMAAINLVGEIGEGFYIERFLGHFTKEDLTDLVDKCLRNNKFYHDIYDYLETRRCVSLADWGNEATNFFGPWLDSFDSEATLVSNDFNDRVLTWQSCNGTEMVWGCELPYQFTVDQLMEGILVATKASLPSLAGEIVEAIKACHYPRDCYLVNAGEYSRRLIEALWCICCVMYDNGCRRDRAYGFEWSNEFVTISKGQRPLMRIRNRYSMQNAEQIRVLDPELAGLIAQQECIGCDSCVFLRFPKESECQSDADFARQSSGFVESIISVLKTLSPVTRVEDIPDTQTCRTGTKALADAVAVEEALIPKDWLKDIDFD